MVIGTVWRIKPHGVLIDIGSVSRILHLSEISHEHIDTPNSVFNVNDEVKVIIIDLDAERGRLSLSTKQLEPNPGDMTRDPQSVYAKAEEMAAKYRERLLEAQRAKEAGIALPPEGEEFIPSAEEGIESPAESTIAPVSDPTSISDPTPTEISPVDPVGEMTPDGTVDPVGEMTPEIVDPVGEGTVVIEDASVHDSEEILPVAVGE